MIELFLFSWGSEIRRYTSSAVKQNWNGEDWEPYKIQRGSVKLEASMEGQNVRISCPVDSDMAALFKTHAPTETVGVTIYRGDGVNTQSIWMGEVAKVAFGPSVASMTCSPTISLGRSNLPIGRFSVGCRWQLYSRACGADINNFLVATTIIQRLPGDKKIIVTEVPQFDYDDFIGGFYIAQSGKRHLIIGAEQEGAGQFSVLLSEYPVDISGSTSAALVPGCNHTTDDCRDKFNNIYNYGGFPAIPPRS